MLELAELVADLRRSLGVRQKQDIQAAARYLGQETASTASALIRLGDDCAAIPDGEGYLLLAAEGMWSVLVEQEPWFAGWCSVLVNVSDTYAMGGQPIAVVDALWSPGMAQADELWHGMVAASRALNVPIVGGHTNCQSPYAALAVAILGRAQHLLTSFNAQPDDVLLLVSDWRGQAHPRYPFWDAATQAPPARLQADLALLPALAQSGECDAAKDVSMGGLLGTVVMLMETSRTGARIDLDQIPHPATVTLDWWLRCFPSYGFLLSVRSPYVATVQAHFQARDLVCTPIGTVTQERQVVVRSGAESVLFWDFTTAALTGF